MTEPSSESDRQSKVNSELLAAGVAVAKSKSGNVLRVDFRTINKPIDLSLIPPIAGCPQLRELYLSQLDLDDSTLAPLTKLQKLKVVDLEGTRVGDESLVALCRLPQITVINVRGTEVSQDLVAQLRKKMTGTRIIGP